VVTLIIPCAGRASRMGEPARELPKALLPVAGRPMLERLVEDASAADVRARLVTRPDDVHIRAWAQRHVEATEIRHAPFEPYGTTLLRAAESEREVAAVDGDLVLPSGGLTAFLRFAAHEAPEANLVVGVTRTPRDYGPLTIWWDPQSDDRCIGRDLPSPVSHLAGITWLRPAALERLQEYDNAGHTSYSAFLATFSRDEVAAFELDYVFNVNTPSDLELANTHVALATRTNDSLRQDTAVSPEVEFDRTPTDRSTIRRCQGQPSGNPS
jgi:NDP-sugar pyrophosphorylase family protein